MKVTLPLRGKSYVPQKCIHAFTIANPQSRPSTNEGTRPATINMNTRREIVLEKDSVAGKPFILSQAVTIVLNCEQAEAKPLSLRKLQMVQQV